MYFQLNHAFDKNESAAVYYEEYGYITCKSMFKYVLQYGRSKTMGSSENRNSDNLINNYIETAETT